MFFILSKILSIFLSPLIWIFALLIWVYFAKSRASSKRILLGALLMFYIFSNGFIAEEALRLWEQNSAFYSEDEKTYDVGIVLSGGLIDYDESTNKLVYGQSSDRIMQALKMYNEGVIDKILITGSSGNLFSSEYNESILARAFLLNSGIDKNDILIEPNSRNTHENAMETKKLLAEQFPDGDFLLFTSALHMRRAHACFIKEGVDIDIYSTNNTIVRRENSFEFLFLPSALSIYQWDSLIHEVTGYFIYKIAGYI
ncbi:MAG: YdcF family protein [Bacteroidota bacterium]